MIRMFKGAGFILVRKSGSHYWWACPCGHAHLSSPKTPGKGRKSRCQINTKGDIARTLRVCNQQERKAA